MNVSAEPEETSSPRRRQTLGAAYDHGRRNSLGLLRLVFASFVVIGHAWPTSGNGVEPLSRWSDGREGLGGLGVAGFFVISGFLVTQSAYRLSLPRYLWHRALRIFPAFLVCLVVTAFVVAPLLWIYEYRGIRAFFRTGDSPFDYVTSNAMLGMSQWSVSGLPKDVPYTALAGQPVFDGPLWTLEYEFGCYPLIAALAVLGLRRWGSLVLPALLAAAWVGIILLHPSGEASDFDFYGPVPVVGGWINPFYVAQFVLLFLCGATLAAHRRRVPLSNLLALICLGVVAATLFVGGYRIVGYAAISYFVLWLGVRLPTWTRGMGNRWDLSYGIYIYAFVIQQTLAELGVRSIGLHLVATFLITVPIAAASWWFIERPALGLKNMRFPRVAGTPLGKPATATALDVGSRPLHPIDTGPVDPLDLVEDPVLAPEVLDGNATTLQSKVVDDHVAARRKLGVERFERNEG